MGRRPGPNAPAPLSEQELAVQRTRGLAFRALMDEATADLLEGVRNPGLLLSGGIDSTSTLWSMMAAGVRPRIYSFATPGTEPGRDSRKAAKIAEHYGLDFTMVTMPDDPNLVATQTQRLVQTHENLTTRSDIEVVFLFLQLMDAAAADGVDGLFTGIGDGAIHMSSREYEVRGRRGLLPDKEVAIRQVLLLDNDQFAALSAEAIERGMSLLSPLRCVVHQLPYSGVSWRVMNLPKEKAITAVGYEAEAQECGVLLRSQAMQVADSGSREYFDTMLSTSDYARQVAGRQISSATVYYNSLQKEEHGRGRRARRGMAWDTFRRNVVGTTPPSDWDPHWALTTDGRGAQPPVDELFGDLDREEPIVLTEDGVPDARVDCWGAPFWEGSSAMNGCLRAQLGWCGTYAPQVPHDTYACESFEVWYTQALDEFFYTAEQHEGRVGAKAYRAWAERAEGRKADLVSDYSSILSGVAPKVFE